MISILMDTSTSYLVVGLVKDGKFLEKRQITALKKQSEEAVPMLQEVLENHGLKVKDVNEAIVTIGPGAYTGVRVALTIMKTLAVILPIRVKAVSSLAIYNEGKPTLAILDARGKKAYVGVYQDGNSEELLMSLDELNQYINEHPAMNIEGQRSLAGLDDHEYDLCELIYQASLKVDYVEDVKALVPHYIKNVEILSKGAENK